MNNSKIIKELFLGCILGILSCFLGSYLFIIMFTKYSFAEGIENLKAGGHLGQLITLGAVLNIILFFVLLQFNKEIMARGIVMATIILTLITLIV